jgi:hypothetical protein
MTMQNGVAQQGGVDVGKFAFRRPPLSRLLLGGKRHDETAQEQGENEQDDAQFEQGKAARVG